MLRNFFISFRLRSAYKTNSIIYSLKSIVLIRRLLPSTLYASRGIKTFARIISGLSEVFTAFSGKAFYVFIIYIAASQFKADAPDSFSHILIFLTLIGGFFNMSLFNPTRDKFYALVLMRMDAKAYTLSNYIYFLIKQLTGLMIFCFVFMPSLGVRTIVLLCAPIYVVSTKLCFSALSLKVYKQKHKLINENNPTKYHWAGLLVFFIIAFLPPYYGISLKSEVLLFLTAALIIPTAFAAKYVLSFDKYRAIYKELLKPENYVGGSIKKIAGAAQKTAMEKKISSEPVKTSGKSGYKYFNEIFMRRHFKLLTRSAKRITIIFTILFAATAVASFMFANIKSGINDIMLTFLPYFLFLMYIINTGKTITQAMFLNCDHSMLSYRFYRQPKSILLLFIERLKYIVLINLMPAGVIAAGLSMLLYITGGTDNAVNYVLLSVSVISMSVFFSVHNIVLYYLLQPYNAALEAKSAAYGIANFVTYLLCYLAIGRKMPTLIFGTAITAFCILYVIAALILAYRLAPKTFKLRQ